MNGCLTNTYVFFYLYFDLHLYLYLYLSFLQGMRMQCTAESTALFTQVDEGDKCVGYLFAIQQIFQQNVRIMLRQFTEFSKERITGIASKA